MQRLTAMDLLRLFKRQGLSPLGEKTLARVNRTSPAYSRIAQRHVVWADPAEAPLPRTVKGNVSRKQAVRGPRGRQYNFTSGWLDSQGLRSQKQGRFEIRARLPSPCSAASWRRGLAKIAVSSSTGSRWLHGFSLSLGGASTWTNTQVGRQ